MLIGRSYADCLCFHYEIDYIKYPYPKVEFIDGTERICDKYYLKIYINDILYFTVNENPNVTIMSDRILYTEDEIKCLTIKSRFKNK